MTPDGIGYSAAVILAVFFMVSAVTKLANRGGTAAAFAQLGVPAAAPLATIVPVTEVVIALALVLVPVAGAVAALGSLAFFTTFLALRLRAGVAAPCGCLGQLSTRALSITDLVRNATLIVFGLVALLAPVPTRPTLLDLAVVLLLVGAAIMTMTVTNAMVSSPATPVTRPGVDHSVPSMPRRGEVPRRTR